MLNYRAINEEVLYTQEAITHVNAQDIDQLKALALKNRRLRVRLCTHADPGNAVHEMLIVHARDTYVRPHKHIGKPESFHMVEGRLTVVIFSDDGRVRRFIPMGEKSSGASFYYRIPSDVFHTLLIETDFAVFHETTSGPFRLEDKVPAAWSPDEEDEQGQARYRRELEMQGPPARPQTAKPGPV